MKSSDPFFQTGSDEESSSDDEPEEAVTVNDGDNVSGKKRARVNKNRPVEVSSKRAVPRLREVVDTSKRKVRDPRFESLCGSFNEDTFRKTHSFLYNEVLPGEKEELGKQLKKVKSEDKKYELKKRIQQVANQIKTNKDKAQAVEKAKVKKKEQKEAVKAGAKPFYKKQGDKRKDELIEKYKQLKANGNLEKFLAKRRKKNAAKDHKLLPHQRRVVE